MVELPNMAKLCEYRSFLKHLVLTSHSAQANAKSEERAQKRRKTIMEAKRNGTYVHKKKSRSVPPWAYYLDWDDDDDYGYCDCGDCDH